MGDSESSVPPSKKRFAETEISKDDPGLDDDGDGDDLQDILTFKRANAEVMASRRTVKVRRNSPPSSASNPFMGIRLVPPVKPIASADDSSMPKEDAPPLENLTAESNPEEEDDSLTTPKEDAVPLENTAAESNPEGDDDSLTTPKEDDALPENVIAAESNPKEDDTERAKEETEDVADANAEKAASLSSFGHLSSSQNAFSGLAGTGVSMANVASDPSTAPISAPNFKFPTNGSPSSSSLSNNLGSQIIPNSRESVFPVLEALPETGEENETAVFSTEATLFEFIGGSWRERGKGEVKVNVSATGPNPKKARLLMRTRGNLRLILNASLYPDMKLTDMDRRGVSFVCVNASRSRESEQNSLALSTLALRFKEEELKEKFTSTVMEHKGNTPARLNSLENSPGDF